MRFEWRDQDTSICRRLLGALRWGYAGSLRGLNGGGGGIRTHETLLGPNGFQDRRFQPLTHPSGGFDSSIECGCDWVRLQRRGYWPRVSATSVVGAALLLNFAQILRPGVLGSHQQSGDQNVKQKDVKRMGSQLKTAAVGR